MEHTEKVKLINNLNAIVLSIQDTGIYGFTRQLLDVAPLSFWERRASRNHHPEDERGECGNLIHTIRVAKTADILCHIPDITGISRDIIISAATLHDICRYGLDDKAEFSVDEHAQLVRKLAEEHGITCVHSHTILKMIEDHMGRWGASHYMPAIESGAIVHIADCICARVAEILNKEDW